MIEQIYNYFTIEMLYYWVNLGVIPFWLMLIFFPQSYLSRFFVTSILPIILLSGAYIFVLYIGLDGLSELFTNNFYIMFFWIHFIAINLFTGGWMVKDSQKFSINKILLSIPLIVTYLIGPLGLFVYWLIKIFHAKSINLHD